MPVVTFKTASGYYPRPLARVHGERQQCTVDLINAMPEIVIAAIGTAAGKTIAYREVLIDLIPPFHPTAINAPFISIVVVLMWSEQLEKHKMRLLSALTVGVNKRISQLPDHLRPVVDIEVLFAHGCGLTLAGGVTARWDSGPIPT